MNKYRNKYTRIFHKYEKKKIRKLFHQIHPNPRTCKQCPSWDAPALSAEVLARPLTVIKWGETMDPRKGKMVHALHPVTLTVAASIKELGKQIVKMVPHIFKMR